jgi:hypothetical protein
MKHPDVDEVYAVTWFDCERALFLDAVNAVAGLWTRPNGSPPDWGFVLFYALQQRGSA